MVGYDRGEQQQHHGLSGRSYRLLADVWWGMTGASSNSITDSAAGATAYSTARKTFNGALGVIPKEDPAAADAVTKKLHQVLSMCRLY